MDTMTERKRTKAEERAYAELEPVLQDLRLLQAEMRAEYLALQLETIPPEWHLIEDQVPVRRRRVRITAAYDDDVAKFFRGMGEGYQARMNAVLRAYMLAVRSKVIRSKKDEDWMGREM